MINFPENKDGKVKVNDHKHEILPCNLFPHKHNLAVKQIKRTAKSSYVHGVYFVWSYRVILELFIDQLAI